MKIDGFYSLPVENIGLFAFGGRIRATSGIPIGALSSGNVPGYNIGESYLLPRGSAGRTGFTPGSTPTLPYGHKLSHGMRARGVRGYLQPVQPAARDGG